MPALAQAPAQAQPVPEYVMKATYLYNFMVFSEWPSQDLQPPTTPREGLNLCVFGQDSFGSALSNLEGKNVNGRRLSVLRMNHLPGIKKCHLLFITEREAPNMPSIQSSLGDAPVLTVADSPLASGAAIMLSVDGSRLVFDVNVQRVKKLGINLSSKVLQLARSTN
ncbi:YfiR family protein [Paucibacter sp. AS339]|uniref:YfiR family protein n=1 Tax=Paucibacter hankyongi TaxID=3133434 RepID=UPI0030965762